MQTSPESGEPNGPPLSSPLCPLPVAPVSQKGACARNLAPQVLDLLPGGCTPSYPGSGGQWSFHAWSSTDHSKQAKKVFNGGN